MESQGKSYPEGGKLIDEFGAGLRGPTPALADRKILIQRVYRRALARCSDAIAVHAAAAGHAVEAGSIFKANFIRRGES